MDSIANRIYIYRNHITNIHVQCKHTSEETKVITYTDNRQHISGILRCHQLTHV